MTAPEQPHDDKAVDKTEADKELAHVDTDEEKAREQQQLDEQMRLSDHDRETIDAIKNDDEGEFKSSD